MINNKDINVRFIIHVAKCPGDLRKKVVFVGGCATGLFITDPAMPEVRATQDVDVMNGAKCWKLIRRQRTSNYDLYAIMLIVSTEKRNQWCQK
jgi:hypothetical protein